MWLFLSETGFAAFTYICMYMYIKMYLHIFVAILLHPLNSCAGEGMISVFSIVDVSNQRRQAKKQQKTNVTIIVVHMYVHIYTPHSISFHCPCQWVIKDIGNIWSN